jgi:gluconate 5-dehydrogenase
MKVKDMFDLKGKTAVVTGGSIGLGAQMATSLAEAGANVVVAARKVDRCIELAAELEKSNDIRAIGVACDVSKANDCQNLVDTAAREFTTLDILVNNAGITWGADSLDFPMDKWQKVMDLNVTGLFQLSAMAARVMRKQGKGKIINISSVAALGGSDPADMDAVVYNASKGAVFTMTRDLAVKWARYGINVNAIAPGFFPTHMSSGLLEKNIERVLLRVPFKRLGGDEDLKGVIVFLSSAASDYITGQFITVDGGQAALI